MHFIVNLIEYCLSRKKTLVYVTFSMKEYYKIAAKLKAGSIKYRTATTANMSSSPGGPYSDYGSEYKVYVQKEDKDKALEAIHH
ncbi:hypothetical protein [Halobacillus massiliensis]|uniref:hypothetical protein n=1 Tax=Halobacillus massiliensis TaxID=1926286 RepID=UPI0009E5EAAD|nr:hypothetical protein [Halobacillus massiliensis]